MNEWYTPKEYIETIREVFGGVITLDPMSCSFAQQVVQAEMYYTKEDNGLIKPWFGNVFLNPPYSYPLIEQSVLKLITDYKNGLITRAITLVNGGSSDTYWYHKLLSSASSLCIHKGRIKFYSEGGVGNYPRYTNHFFYLGYDMHKFNKRFQEYGKILHCVTFCQKLL